MRSSQSSANPTGIRDRRIAHVQYEVQHMFAQRTEQRVLVAHACANCALGKTALRSGSELCLGQ